MRIRLFALCFFTMLLAPAMIRSQAPEREKSMAQLSAPQPTLPTPREAVFKVDEDAKKAGRVATAAETLKAWQAAREAEIAAIVSGHGARVSDEEIDSCLMEIAAAKNEAASRANDEAVALAAAQRKRDLVENHCPSYVQIGTSRECVDLIFGRPDEVNSDLRGPDQLVYSKYPDGTPRTDYLYVYIDRRSGLVQDMQSTTR